LNATYEKVFPGLWVDDEGVIRFDESGRVTSDPTGAPN
jgi:hypothetical protein